MNYYSLEAEAAFIGCILIDQKLAMETSVLPEYFYDPDHADIYNAIFALRETGRAIDIVTVVTELKERIEYLGGVKRISDMAQSVPSTTSFKSYESIIIEKHVYRSGLTKMHELKSTEFEDPAHFLNSIRDIADSLEDHTVKGGGLKHVSESVDRHADDVMNRSEGRGSPSLINLGVDLHKITGGWREQDFVVLAARPSVGKTAAMLEDAKANAKVDDTVVGIFSAEMPEQLLIERMIASECNIDGNVLLTGQLDSEEWQRYTMGASIIRELEMYIDDTPGMSIQQVRRETKKLRDKNKGKKMAIYVDYLQLLNGGMNFSNKQAEVAHISKTLKRIARENQCSVIALAQLSRSVEQRQDKRPMMSDLRDSGTIEQDADKIIFMYRDDYYNQESEKKNIVEFNVAKNRNGSTGTAELVFIKNFSRFLNYERVQADMFN